MVMNLDYHLASEKDLPLIFELAERIWKPTFRPLFTEEVLEKLFKGMYDVEKLTKWLSISGNEMYILKIQNKPIGYLAIEILADHLKLDKIYVDQRLQGKGIGGRIMHFIEKRSFEAGKDEIQLRVNRGNEKAITFYQNHDFQITEEINFPGPEGSVYEDYIMKKNLTAYKSL